MKALSLFPSFLPPFVPSLRPLHACSIRLPHLPYLSTFDFLLSLICENYKEFRRPEYLGESE